IFGGVFFVFKQQFLLIFLQILRVLVESKKVGVVILAGGDATRLGLDIPKGCLELHGISLFERILSRCPGIVAVMVSEKNLEAVSTFFHAIEMGPSRLHIFVQKSAPILQGEGSSPMGNGDLFRAMKEEGILDLFQDQGVEKIVVCPVDNPLVQPTLEVLQSPMELVVLGVEKRHAFEAVGTLIEEDKLSVIEYTKSTSVEGLAYTGIFSADIDFFRRAAKHDSLVPVHHVLKIQNGKSVIKQEKFVFDFFPLAKSYYVAKVDRTENFYPIKRQAGDDSLEEALRILR
ncbi:MAG: UTP--glucose-1-phosphate uridylyltransferase, partial [Chlamydiia bacterium]